MNLRQDIRKYIETYRYSSQKWDAAKQDSGTIATIMKATEK